MENWQFILIAGLLLAAPLLLVVLLVRQSAPARITERFSGARWERTSGP